MMLQLLKNHQIIPEDRLKKIPDSFFQSENVVDIARSLLGKVICSNIDGVFTSVVITETEAYRAPEDKASHAAGNLRTKRTEVMFGAGGHSYVYLCYGIHYLFNIVTGPKEMAHAVLIRASQPLFGLEQMLKRRKMKNLKPNVTAGPAHGTQALGIKTIHSSIDLNAKNSPIWLEDQGFEIDAEMIISSPRVGVGYAEECAAWPWRFRIKDSKWTSPAK